jgi:FMN-dependent NADH-azoreductase
MTLFRLDASIMPANSAGAELADIVQTARAQVRSDEPVIRRNVGVEPLPAQAWTDATLAAFTPDADRTPAQREALALAAELAGELQSADAAIFAVPLYNFGVSQHFKTWVDLVIAGAGPTTPLLKDKPTVLVSVRGGGYGPGTPREGWDHSTAYLRRVLADVWEADLTIIERELTLAGTAPGMEPLRDMATDLHSAARAWAAEVGAKLATR